MCEYFHSFSKYWLSFCDDEAAVLDTGHRAENKINETFALCHLHCNGAYIRTDEWTYQWLWDAKECDYNLCSEVAFSFPVKPSPGTFKYFRNFASILLDFERWFMTMNLSS